MFYWLSVGEVEYITDFEWLNTSLIIQVAKCQVHLLNLTRHLQYLDHEGRSICGLKLILSNVWHEQCEDY